MIEKRERELEAEPELGGLDPIAGREKALKTTACNNHLGLFCPLFFSDLLDSDDAFYLLVFFFLKEVDEKTPATFGGFTKEHTIVQVSPINNASGI